MAFPYQQYRNISGKYLQWEQRLSDEFKFYPNELITILYPGEAEHNSGNIPGYIIYCPANQGVLQSLQNGWISEKYLNEHFELVPPPIFKGQLELFNYVWDSRPHISQLSGKPLLPKGSMQWHHQFLHILPKGTYKHWKLNPENILLARPEEHDVQERFPYFLELRQKLTLVYHLKYR